MATSKHYAYYLEGNKVAIVEKDVSFDNDVDSKDYGPGASQQRWESPQSTVADALEVKYVYSPNYRLIGYSSTSTLTSYYGSSSDGKLRLADAVSSYTDYDALFDAGDYIVLTNAGKFNGLHKVTAIQNLIGTNNVLVTDTIYTPTATGVQVFEETPGP